MSISEHAAVRVTSEIPVERIDPGAGLGRVPRVGDLGAVVLVHAMSRGEPAFTVECVDPDGPTVWVADVFASEIERVPSTAGRP